MLGSGAGLASAVLAGCGSEKPIAERVEPEGSATVFRPDFKVGFQAYSLRHFAPMETFIPEAKKLGLDYVELYSALLARLQ